MFNLKTSYLTILILLVITITGAYIVEQKITTPPEAIVKNFNDLYNTEEHRLERVLGKILLNPDSFFINELRQLKTLERSGIGFFYFKNSECIHWSTNQVKIRWLATQLKDSIQLIKSPTCFYEVVKKNISEGEFIIATLALKNEWPHQNEYLQNKFVFDNEMPENTQIVALPEEGSIPVKSIKGLTLFHLKLNGFTVKNKAALFTSILFYIISGVLSIWLLLQLITETFKKDMGLRLLLFAVSLFIIRWGMIAYKFPQVFYEMGIYNPQHYANADNQWFSLLGDVFINTLFFLLLCVFLYMNKAQLFSIQSKIYSALLLGCLVVSTVFCASIYFYYIQHFISDSSISFDLNNMIKWDEYSLFGFLILAIALGGFYILTDLLAHFIHLQKGITPLAILICLLPCLYFFNLPFYTISLIFVGCGTLLTLVLLARKNNPNSFIVLVTHLAIYTFFSVYLFEKKTEEKEIKNLSVFSNKLAEEKDVIAEYLFNEIAERLVKDTLLTKSFTSESFSEMENTLRNSYFEPYWDKYSIQILGYDSLCFPVHKLTLPELSNNSYLDEIIQQGDTTTCKNLYYVSGADNKNGYVAKFSVNTSANSNSNKYAHLYIKFESRITPENIGFPELLLDKKLLSSFDFNEYSYALYKDNKLVNRYGKYQYPSIFSTKPIDDDYRHFTFMPDKNVTTVISRPNVKGIQKISGFSLFFMMLSLVLIFSSTARLLFTNRLRTLFISLKWRTQFSLVLLVFLASSTFALFALLFIQNANEEEIKNNLNQKLNSISVELQEKLQDEVKIDANYGQYINTILKKYSTVFFADIMLYAPNGNLIGTSNTAIFDEGLLSNKMNPYAYAQFVAGNASRYTNSEHVGKLNYLSGYIPLINKQGNSIAYINLPYFSQQKEYDKKIANYITSIINIYVVLLVISVLLSISISNQLTRPLQLIQQKLSTLTLQKAHELIDWQKQDEIGQLVSAYNTAVMELERSAQALARSERESAWKEMAKQVAHEIKNPLTPMKLNIQHLQRMWHTKNNSFEKNFETLTNSLLEQIDTLSLIATAFSDFAKMPAPTLEKIDLIEQLNQCVLLYTTSVTINKHYKSDTPIFINADKDQLARALSNIVKNAIQSMQNESTGIIDIYCSVAENKTLIQIKDNGLGIPDEMKVKIFSPNFTTKSTGMGLGLSMTKNSIESFGGKIWFESETGKGTSFFIELPISYYL